MQRLFRNIVAAVMLALAIVSCSRKGRVIPKDTLSQIYADMFLVDQWISKERERMKAADTSLVYEPVLARYGYNSEDYRATVAAYLSEPDKYADVFKGSTAILKAYIDDIVRADGIKAKLDSIHRARARRTWLKFDTDNLDSLIFSPGRLDSICGILPFVPPSMDTAAVQGAGTLPLQSPDSAGAAVQVIAAEPMDRPVPVRRPDSISRLEVIKSKVQ